MLPPLTKPPSLESSELDVSELLDSVSVASLDSEASALDSEDLVSAGNYQWT